RAAARRAGLVDDRALAAAGTTRLGDREEALLEADLAGATAFGTTPRLGAGARPASLAVAALRQARDGDRLFGAARGLFKEQLEPVLEILSTSRPCAPAAPAARAEEVPEEIAQHVLEAAAELEAAEAGATLLERGVPEPVVLRATGRVRQDLVRLADLFEALLRLRAIVGIFIGMPLDRELAVGLLQVLLARRPLDAEELVVVALHRQTQEPPPPMRVRAPLLCTGHCRKRAAARVYSLTSSNSASTTSSLSLGLAFPSSPVPAAFAPGLLALAYICSASLCEARASSSPALRMRAASSPLSASFASARARSTAAFVSASSDAALSAMVFSVW